MNKAKIMYLKNRDDVKVIRTELILAPFLVVFPVFVAFLFFYDWFHRGFLLGDSAFNGELILGIIILVGNIMFDIPFLKSLKKSFKKN